MIRNITINITLNNLSIRIYFFFRYMISIYSTNIRQTINLTTMLNLLKSKNFRLRNSTQNILILKHPNRTSLGSSTSLYRLISTNIHRDLSHQRISSSTYSSHHRLRLSTSSSISSSSILRSRSNIRIIKTVNLFNLAFNLKCQYTISSPLRNNGNKLLTIINYI
jgi:hypothetical protein